MQFRSKIVNTILPYHVVLPPHYESFRATRYPALYLLHGLTGHYSDWITRTNLADYAAQYDLIVVTPEGNDGWYTDSATIKVDKYESYFLRELLPDVERRYRTIEARHARGVAGLSMGGYGALKFGLKYPHLFAFAGSMSGAFSVVRRESRSGDKSWESVTRAFGPVDSPTRKANDLFLLVRDVSPQDLGSLPFFYLDCGTEDSADLFASNRELDELLLEKKIPHEYRELPGSHSWAYWDRQVQEILRIAAQKLRVARRSSGGFLGP